MLRSSPPPENFAFTLSPCGKSIPSPAPLIFTPKVVEKVAVENFVEVEKDLKVQEGVSCCNCDAQMTPGHQCELKSDKIEDSVTAKVVEEDESDESDVESVKSEQDLYPTLDVDSDYWAEKFTNSIRRFHGSNQ